MLQEHCGSIIVGLQGYVLLQHTDDGRWMSRLTVAQFNALDLCLKFSAALMICHIIVIMDILHGVLKKSMGPLLMAATEAS